MNSIKKYFIIGASSEVGIACLKRLEERAEAGTEVIAHYASNAKELLELKESFSRLILTPVQADLSNQNQVELMLEQAGKTGPADCLIYLAADKLEYQKLKKLDWEKVAYDFEVQVHGLVRVSRECLPAMAKKGYGKAVIMLSECTLGMPPRFMSGYVTVKYAMLGLMKALAAEYADKGLNINGISPGMMDTKFLSRVDERLIAMAAAANVTGRNVTVEETAETVLFLASSGSDYMNGVNLNVTGGNR